MPVHPCHDQTTQMTHSVCCDIAPTQERLFALDYGGSADSRCYEVCGIDIRNRDKFTVPRGLYCYLLMPHSPVPFKEKQGDAMGTNTKA
jgi:hypothetical protein